MYSAGLGVEAGAQFSLKQRRKEKDKGELDSTLHLEVVSFHGNVVEDDGGQQLSCLLHLQLEWKRSSRKKEEGTRARENMKRRRKLISPGSWG